MAKQVRSRGAVQLARVGETQEAIAAKVKCSRVEVAYFQSGKRKPGPMNRTRFRRHYNIPETAWDEEPETVVSEHLYTSTNLTSDSVEDRVARLQRTIDKIQEEALTDGQTTRREKLAELKAAIEATALLAKLTGESQQISEAKLLKLPQLRNIFDRLLAALEPWPEAMHAAGKALKGEH